MIRQFICGAIVILASCVRVAGPVSYSKEIVCISRDGNDDQVVSVWCGGKLNHTDCKQAQMRVVQQMLFDGIKFGQAGCNPAPIILDPDVRRLNTEYFRTFFSEEGDYLLHSRIENRGGIAAGCQKDPHLIFVRVFTSRLGKDLVSKKIIKGF